MNREELLVECERLSRDMPEVIVKTERKDIPLPFGVRGIYRDFILSQFFQSLEDQRIKIDEELENILKGYPDVLLKAFIETRNLKKIKEKIKETTYADILKKMEETYAYEEMINICSSIIELIEEEKDEDLEFYYNILNIRANVKYFLGCFKEASEDYEKALKIAIEKKIADSNPFGWLGVTYFNQRKYGEAIKYLQHAHHIARSFQEKEEIEGFWLGSLGNAFRDSGRFQDAMECYEKALKIAKKIGNRRRDESRWLANKGNLYHTQGELAKLLGKLTEAEKYYRQAEDCYQQALDIARSIPDKRLESRWLNNQGNSYYDFGEMEEAIRCYEEGRRIAHEVKDRQNEAICLSNLGMKFTEIGRKMIEEDKVEEGKNKVIEGINYLKDAVKVTKASKDWETEKNYLDMLVNSYLTINQSEMCVKYLNENLDESERWGIREEEEIWLAFLGYIYYVSKDSLKAGDYFKKAYDIAKEIRDWDMEIQLSPFLGEINLSETEELYNANQLDKALDKSIDAITQLMMQNFIQMMRLYQQFYETTRYMRISDLDEKIINYKKEIEKDPSNSALHSELADCYARKGDLEEAILEYQRAIEIDPSKILTVMSKMEVTVWRGLYDEAVSIYQEWKGKITSNEHKVIASWIISTALALSGKPFDEYIEPLLDVGINISGTGYSLEDILPYFSKLIDEGIFMDRLIQAWELHTLFQRHYGKPDLKSIIEEIKKALPDDFTVRTLAITDEGVKAEIDKVLPKEIKENLIELIEKAKPTKITETPLGKTLLKRGLIYRRLDRPNMAIKDYTTILMFDPNNSEIYMCIGGCYAQKGEFEKALVEYKRAIELNSSNVMALLGKMEVEICLKRYGDALRSYRRLDQEKISPKERVIATYLFYLALALVGEGYQRYIGHLEDMNIKIREWHDWCNVEIDRHIAKLEEEGYIPNRIQEAQKIQFLFKRHFEEFDKVGDESDNKKG
ncbi:MAG: tetratricopeptide repeat protein [bacterium]